MPAKARVESRPEFRSAALSTARAACGGVCLAHQPSDSAQAIEITRRPGDITPSAGRVSGIVDWRAPGWKTAKVAEKDTQAIENMGSSTKMAPQKAGLLAQKGARASPNLAHFGAKRCFGDFSGGYFRLCRTRLVPPGKPAHVDSTEMQRPPDRRHGLALDLAPPGWTQPVSESPIRNADMGRIALEDVPHHCADAPASPAMSQQKRDASRKRARLAAGDRGEASSFRAIKTRKSRERIYPDWTRLL